MRVEQNGPETCRITSNGGFVVVRVPVRVTGNDQAIKTVHRYRIGGFIGRESVWPLGGGYRTVLSFRIPHELFREGEHVTLEVLSIDSQDCQETLWTSRLGMRWLNGIPTVEPLPLSGLAWEGNDTPSPRRGSTRPHEAPDDAGPAPGRDPAWSDALED